MLEKHALNNSSAPAKKKLFWISRRTSTNPPHIRFGRLSTLAPSSARCPPVKLNYNARKEFTQTAFPLAGEWQCKNLGRLAQSLAAVARSVVCPEVAPVAPSTPATSLLFYY